MYVSLCELQEANKEVLLGRRKLNCLSCGTDIVKEAQMQGNDGIMYRGKQMSVKLGDDGNLEISSRVLKAGAKARL